MSDIARRFPTNPLLSPHDVRPSREGLAVHCLLNPGVFRFRDKTWLLLRVAEAPPATDEHVSTVVRTPEGGLEVLKYRRDDPDLDLSDPRVFRYRGEVLLTTLSHLRLACSSDGVHFEPEKSPTLEGLGLHETWGIEDCRVVEIEGRFYLTYTAVSPRGIAVGMISTEEWQEFTRHGNILPPCNKDCALFPERVGGTYWALHRPASTGIGSHDIWIARSPDLIHWGGHECLLRVRPGRWDSARIGAGASPIRTTAGWLEIITAPMRTTGIAWAPCSWMPTTRRAFSLARKSRSWSRSLLRAERLLRQRRLHERACGRRRYRDPLLRRVRLRDLRSNALDPRILGTLGVEGEAI